MTDLVNGRVIVRYFSFLLLLYMFKTSPCVKRLMFYVFNWVKEIINYSNLDLPIYTRTQMTIIVLCIFYPPALADRVI